MSLRDFRIVALSGGLEIHDCAISSREEFDRLIAVLFLLGEQYWPEQPKVKAPKKPRAINKGKPPRAGSLDEKLVGAWNGGERDANKIAAKFKVGAGVVKMRLAFLRKRELLA